MTSLPVILCGKTPQIATTVIGSLKPEFEVIHVFLNPGNGKEEIPRILGGQAPAQVGTPNLGTMNYTKEAVAVITGAGYDDAACNNGGCASECKADRSIDARKSEKLLLQDEILQIS